MPTPSEAGQRADGDRPTHVWGTPAHPRKRSVYSNYPAQAAAPAANAPEPAPTTPTSPTSLLDRAPESAVAIALARSFCYRFLAQAFAEPTETGWCWLGEAQTQASLRAGWELLHPSAATVSNADRQETLRTGSPKGHNLSRWPAFPPTAFAAYGAAYVAAFGHAARGRCPLNEIEYGDLKADPLLQPHRLADLAAFYRAFGLDVSDDAGERHDHLGLELEFMTVLAAKEAYALAQGLSRADLETCRAAQKQFLREHLGRWAPAFTRRLEAVTNHATLNALAEFMRAFVASECARHGVSSGSDDLLLRPVDEAAESWCASCSLVPSFPGAEPSAVSA